MKIVTSVSEELVLVGSLSRFRRNLLYLSSDFCQRFEGTCYTYFRIVTNVSEVPVFALGSLPPFGRNFYLRIVIDVSEEFPVKIFRVEFRR